VGANAHATVDQSGDLRSHGGKGLGSIQNLAPDPWPTVQRLLKPAA
jgi:hypothetical protein